MLFSSSVVLALAAFGSAATLKNKRASITETLYVYGNSEASGSSIFYADGLAYFGHTIPPTASVSTNISFTVDTTSTTAAWTISPNNTENALSSAKTVTFNETLELYIVPTNGSFAQVGFATDGSSSLPTGAVQTGFTFFGKSVAYAASESDYQLKFWGANTSDSGVYALYWNADTAPPPAGAFPIAVKSTVPTVPK